MPLPRSWKSLWLTSLVGFAVAGSGCVTTELYLTELYRCPPLTEALLDEYELLVEADITPELRAWIRETDRVCRANAKLTRRTH